MTFLYYHKTKNCGLSFMIYAVYYNLDDFSPSSVPLGVREEHGTCHEYWYFLEGPGSDRKTNVTNTNC